MINPSERRDEALAFVAVAILWVLGTMALLGPVALLIAGVTMSGALIMGWHIQGGLLIVASGAGSGMLLWGIDGWLIGPVNTMVAIYKDYLFDGQRWDFEGLRGLFGQMLMNGPAWPYFAPLGIAAGGLYFTSWHICTGSKLRQTTRTARLPTRRPNLLIRIAKGRVDRAESDTGDGTLIGLDKETQKRVALTDKHANTHTLVLGTTGS